MKEHQIQEHWQRRDSICECRAQGTAIVMQQMEHIMEPQQGKNNSPLTAQTTHTNGVVGEVRYCTVLPFPFSCRHKVLDTPANEGYYPLRFVRSVKACTVRYCTSLRQPSPLCPWFSYFTLPAKQFSGTVAVSWSQRFFFLFLFLFTHGETL